MTTTTTRIANSLFLDSSRYVQGGDTETANNRLEWWERINFPADATDIGYIVENIYEGRLDLLASLFYGDSKLWWFIAQYNNIIDPVGEVTAGRVLYIPTKDRALMMLVGSTGGISSSRTTANIIPSISL